MMSPHAGSIDPNPSESLRTLSDACSPNEWLMKKLSHESEDIKKHPRSWAWFLRSPHPPQKWVKVENLHEHDRITQRVLNLIQNVMDKLNKMYRVFCEGRQSGYYEWVTFDTIIGVDEEQRSTKRPNHAAVVEEQRSVTGDPRPAGADLQVCLNTLKELYIRL